MNNNSNKLAQEVRAVKEKKEKYCISLTPSIHSNATKISYVERRSLSELVETLLKKYVEENTSKLKEYEDITGKKY